MDSLSDHAARRSSGRRPERGSGGTTALINRILLLTGALLFINGVSITFIAILIPVAISSAIVVTIVTALTVLAALVFVARRNPERTRAFIETFRPLIEALSNNDNPRRQGGL